MPSSPPGNGVTEAGNGEAGQEFWCPVCGSPLQSLWLQQGRGLEPEETWTQYCCMVVPGTSDVAQQLRSICCYCRIAELEEKIKELGGGKSSGSSRPVSIELTLADNDSEDEETDDED